MHFVSFVYVHPPDFDWRLSRLLPTLFDASDAPNAVLREFFQLFFFKEIIKKTAGL